MSFDLSKHGISGGNPKQQILRNPSVALLYKLGVAEYGKDIASSGALIADSAAKKGRSPKEKRIVEEETTKADVWWGNVNIPISENSYEINKGFAIGYLKSLPRLFVIDAYAGWDPEYRVKVRVIVSDPYHALFMWNMLIRPTAEELASFGEPEWVMYNAGEMFASTAVPEVNVPTSVNLNFKKKEFVILGSQYAGEMKKGIFTVLNYILPKQGVLSMHCSANEGEKGDVALFFGLSGTGKTTLSADPNRHLIGDDEHGWTDKGVFNFEGGCYAKTVNLSAEGEPQIYNAIRYGALLENVGYDPETFEVDYTDISKTENTQIGRAHV